MIDFSTSLSLVVGFRRSGLQSALMPIPLHRLDMRVEAGQGKADKLNLFISLKIAAGSRSKPYQPELNPNRRSRKRGLAVELGLQLPSATDSAGRRRNDPR